MLGRLLNGQGETEEAAAAYQRAAELDPASAEILGELAELYAQQGRVQDAISTADSALELDSASVQGHWVLGNIYAAFADQPGGGTSSGDSPSPARQAISHLEQARQPRVFNPDLELRLGNLYVQVEDFEAALEILEPLARRTSSSRGVGLGLTDAYAGVGRLDDAVDTLEGLLAEQPFSRGLSSLARLYEMQDRWADAADAYERALQRRPDSRTLKFRLARALLTDGRTAAARDQLQSLIDEDDEQPAIQFLLARTELELGNFQAAESAARRLLELEPDDVRAVYALAEIFQRQRQPQRLVDVVAPIVESLRTRESRDPQMIGLLTRLAFAEIDLGRHDRAVTLLEEARALSRPDASLDAYVGQAYVEAGRLAEALDDLEDARRRFPDDIRLIRLQAEVLQATGDPDAGIALMSQALDDHRDDRAAYLGLAGLHVDGDRFDEATRVLKSALEAFPEEPSILFQLGAALEQQQRYDEAEQAFLRVLSADPAHAPALNYLGYMLADRGDRLEVSIEYIERALDVDPANGAYLDSLGWALFKMNRFEEAEVNLQQASQQLLTNSVIQDHLGQVLFELGRYTEAVVAWERALSGDGESIDRAVVETNISQARERGGPSRR